MEVNNLTDFEVDTNLLRKAVNVVLKGEKEKKKEISIAIVGAEKMKELSRIYRHKDYATDVLSFFYNEKDFLGEIIICPEKIEKDEDFTKEICRVTIHGTLHLLGYDHENDKEEEGMKKKQEDYLQLVI
jgi:probable rRNA maturation factor